jgi:hypothetical protein
MYVVIIRKAIAIRALPHKLYTCCFSHFNSLAVSTYFILAIKLAHWRQNPENLLGIDKLVTLIWGFFDITIITFCGCGQRMGQKIHYIYGQVRSFADFSMSHVNNGQLLLSCKKHQRVATLELP